MTEPPPLDAAQIAEAEALCAAATPGPWVEGRIEGKCSKPSHGRSQHPGRKGDDPCVYDYTFRKVGGISLVSPGALSTVMPIVDDWGPILTPEDLAFIAASRTLVPALISTARHAARRVAELEEEVEGMRDALHAAAIKFLEYEAAHAAKGTDEGKRKAETNARMAKLCEAALSAADTKE